METLVDNAAPITFGQLAARFSKLGMTKTKYNAFRLPLSFEDVTNRDFADEIVGYRPLIAWFEGSWTGRHRRRTPSGTATLPIGS